MLKKVLLYLIAALLGAALGAKTMHMLGAQQLADEKAAHAVDNERHANDMLAVSRAALEGEKRAIDAHKQAEVAIAAADAQITNEKEVHENQNRNYVAALAAGTERLRIAVSNCSAAGRDDVSGTTGTASVGDGAAAYADVDRAVAERVFRVAGDDDNEISKVKVLQAYVCAVRPTTPGCN
ncbi:lysis system i-spanin subunit Rz [Paraburkholderia bryophila]|uniref:Bacteriophage Rz lysis protein n=1 Tax=Paraburkholderia bryophila TaxID=420952 RepID=A0A7Z0AXF9_9BURK|nr:lysis system i-spanin subunit Rz [Paraburkholderia bryophila]NYH13414.1 hypothetical protein [Paraburkholderia bryophila]